MSDKIWMEHPALGPDRKQEVPRKAFKSSWSRNGWVETSPPPEPDPEDDSQDMEIIGYSDLSQLTTEEE